MGSVLILARYADITGLSTRESPAIILTVREAHDHPLSQQFGAATGGSPPRIANGAGGGVELADGSGHGSRLIRRRSQ